jgi:hypothetical protein
MLCTFILLLGTFRGNGRGHACHFINASCYKLLLYYVALRRHFFLFISLQLQARLYSSQRCMTLSSNKHVCAMNIAVLWTVVQHGFALVSDTDYALRNLLLCVG